MPVRELRISCCSDAPWAVLVRGLTFYVGNGVPWRRQNIVRPQEDEHAGLVPTMRLFYAYYRRLIPTTNTHN